MDPPAKLWALDQLFNRPMTSSLLFTAVAEERFHDLLPTQSTDYRLSIAYLVAGGSILLLVAVMIVVFTCSLCRSRVRRKHDIDFLTEDSRLSTARSSMVYDSIVP